MPGKKSSGPIEPCPPCDSLSIKSVDSYIMEINKKRGACRLFREEHCLACGIDRCSNCQLLRNVKKYINIYKRVSREAEFRAHWNSMGGEMFSVQAEPNVSGGFRGNYVASVGPFAPECLQGPESWIYTSFCETHTVLMTQRLHQTHINKVYSWCYNSDMFTFTLSDTAFNACRRLKATLGQMQYIFILKGNKENTTWRELIFSVPMI